jgi:hypothetical protein
MDFQARLQELEAKLQELAQQRAEAQELPARIIEQQVFYAGQRALLNELLAAQHDDDPSD